MTPYEVVREQFAFPFELRPYQIKEVNYLAPLPRAGYYWEPGSGKTAGSTHHALFWMIMNGLKHQIVVLPPILLEQWERWLRSITNLRNGKALTTTLYAGTPAQRAKLDLNVGFLLLSYGLLKNDFERLHDFYRPRAYGVLTDEATAIKNIESQTHKAVALFAEERPLQLLTGTPINKPGDAYAYIKLLAPGIYRNKRQFDRLHIGEVDAYDNPKTWVNLDLLADNMKVNTSRILRREVRDQLPEVLYTPKPYNLDPAHLKLYRRITEERLVEFENGSEIDAITASALRSALQQIVMNWGEFDENPDRRPAGLDMIEEVLEEIGQKKLAVVANFKRTNRYLLDSLAKFGAVAVYGDISAKGKQAAIARFISDDSCRVIMLQPSSAGFGVDGLQHVCSDMLVVEAPTTPTPFEQVVKRLDRDGQEDVVHVRVAIAQGTVQVGMFKSLLENDELANSIQGGYKDLRSLLYGGD